MTNRMYVTVLLFACLLTACGSDPSSAPAVDATGATASPTSGTSASVSPTPTATRETRSAVTFTGTSSGAISGTVLNVADTRSFCGPQELSPEQTVFRLQVDVTVAGKTRALYVNTSPAPGTYSFVRPEQPPGADAPADGGFVLQPHQGSSDNLTLFEGGSVTLAPGLKSGSIKATYLTRASKGKGTLTGTFTC